jgi:hypothetical protein
LGTVEFAATLEVLSPSACHPSSAVAAGVAVAERFVAPVADSLAGAVVPLVGELDEVEAEPLALPGAADYSLEVAAAAEAELAHVN